MTCRERDRMWGEKVTTNYQPHKRWTLMMSVFAMSSRALPLGRWMRRRVQTYPQPHVIDEFC